MRVGRRRFAKYGTNKGEITMVGITLRFDYTWNDSEMDENEIRECLMELSPDELLCQAQNDGNPINVDVEVY